MNRFRCSSLPFATLASLLVLGCHGSPDDGDEAGRPEARAVALARAEVRRTERVSERRPEAARERRATRTPAVGKMASNVANDSCVGFCGGATEACFCDDLCEDFGDCCPDKIDVCGSSESPATPHRGALVKK